MAVETTEGGVPATPLRGVAIGTGYFAPFQYEAWSRLPGVDIVALSSLTEERAREVMARYGVGRFYADWREMLDVERPDFVDIITPPDTHEAMCRYAAERGVHVICQKPLAPTWAESERIVRLAEQAGIRFMVHENWRWQPWYRAIKAEQEKRTVGTFTHIQFTTRLGDGWGDDAYLARQPYFRDYPRLLLYETGAHFIDTFRYLLGEVATVYAQIKRLNPVIHGEDAAVLCLTFDSGATAVWDANRYNETEAAMPRYTFGDMRIDGSLGHITLDADAVMRVKALGEPSVELKYDREPKNFAGDCVYALQRHFVESVRSGRRFEAEGADYLRTIAVVEAAYQSAVRGEVVRLPPHGPEL